MERNYTDIERNLSPDTEQPYQPTLTASATTTLTKFYPIIAVTLQASGTSILKLAPAQLWNNQPCKVYVIVDGGGEMQLVDSAGNDLLGDNFGAVGDYAILENVGGRLVAAVKEVSS